MPYHLNLGLTILLISAFGFISNWLNGRYLNYQPIRTLYYIGALVHELSHALLCVLTGAKIEEIVIFSSQPHVTHRPSRIPVIGEALISIAPIAGGLLFLFLVNRYLLGNYFMLPQLAGQSGWSEPEKILTGFLAQVNIFTWQSWVMIFLFFNVGAMLGPSPRDLKNIWLALIVLFFISWPLLEYWGIFAIIIILINIVLQLALILIKGILRTLFLPFGG
jgi:hypothetical protein